MIALLALSLLGTSITLSDWGETADTARTGIEEVACDGGPHSATIWGSQVYTGDSDVCTAAVHAGVIRQGESATVRIEWGPGRRSFEGSDRNGIESHEWESYPTSYHFPALGRRPQDETPPAPGDMRAWTGAIGERIEIVCEPSDLDGGSVWGTGWYTADSSPCRAALHAGVISAKGGKAVVEMAEGRESYRGSLRRGVSSSSWDDYDASFFFPAAPPEALPPSGRELLRTHGLLGKTKWFVDDGVSWEVLFVDDGAILATAHARGRVTARLVGTWIDGDGGVDVRARLYMMSDDEVTEHPNVAGWVVIAKDAKGLRLESDGALGFQKLRPPTPR